MAGTVLRIPHFITSRSPKGLQDKMLKNNLKDGIEYNYFDISFDGKNWIAWFKKQLSLNGAKLENG